MIAKVRDNLEGYFVALCIGALIGFPAGLRAGGDFAAEWQQLTNDYRRQLVECVETLEEAVALSTSTQQWLGVPAVKLRADSFAEADEP